MKTSLLILALLYPVIAFAEHPAHTHEAGVGLWECDQGYVMHQENGGSYCVDQGSIAQQRFEVSTVPSAGNGAAGTCPAGGCDAAIGKKCAQEWPSDYSMQLYCVKRQRTARAAIDGRVDSIADHCAAEWPSDYSMQAYCQKKQVDAARELGR